MKTSKKIFIGMLTIITLLMIASIAENRYKGSKKIVYELIRKTLSPFKVICLQNSGNTVFVQSDSTYIEIFYRKDSLAPDLKYHLAGDTLILSEEQKELGIVSGQVPPPVSKTPSIWLKLIEGEIDHITRIHTSDSLHKIISRNSHIDLTNFNLLNLSLELDHCNLSMQKVNGEICRFRFLNILAKNHSNIVSNFSSIDSLEVNLRESKARLEIQMLKIHGNLADSSKISLVQVNDISLKKDKSSAILMFYILNSVYMMD